MRVFRVLLTTGGIFLIVGVYLAIPAAAVSGNGTYSVPAGNFYYRIIFNVQKAGRISGQFSETSGSIVTLYVFTSAQFDSYRNGVVSQDLFAITGSSGGFSASVAFPGDYYLVIQHGASFVNQAEAVQLTWQLDGSNFFLLGLGITIFVVGVILTFLGYRLRSRGAPPPSTAGVILFDQPKSESTTPGE